MFFATQELFRLSSIDSETCPDVAAIAKPYGTRPFDARNQPTVSSKDWR